MKPFLFAILGGALLVSHAAYAQTETVTSPPLRAPAAPSATLPLTDVVVYSSGVAYFGRSGQVEGNASVDLPVRAPQVSDILKSLVLFDAKGKVDPVTYSIQDYIASRPTTTDLNIDPNSSPGAILRLLQGAQVRIERQAGTIEGRVVSVSTQQIKDGDTLRTVESATILTATGLTTIRLDDVISFTPLDRGLAEKFAASLEKKANYLTKGLDDGVRPVTIRFRGNGKRDVRAGYLLESPVWKTSYRLVLAPKAKPYLQGWAVVENPGDEDWNNVNLSLVSGRPVSFIQDTATPIYVVRPVVPPQVIGSPRPQTFGPGYGGPNDRIVQSEGAPGMMGAMGGGGGFGGMGGFGGNMPVPAPTLRSRGGRGNVFSNSGALSPSAALDEAAEAATRTAVQNQVDSQATGAQQGNLFVYAIDTKVTIPRGQAAMVPIVSEDIEGEAVSIVLSQNVVGPLAPQNGFRLRNRGDLNLQGGPIAVYADGIYGGDALITNVSPGEIRLITYALDLDLVSRLESSEENIELLAIRATGGTLELTKKATRVQKYIFRNKTNTAKTVVLQQPNESEWKLVNEKQLFEKSNDGLRFKIEVPAGKTINYDINLEKPVVEAMELRELSPDQIGYYAQFTKISPDLKAKLQNIITLKKRANDLVSQRGTQEKLLKDINEGQARIRQNMAVLDRTSPLYKTYESKLQEQENQINKLEAEIVRLRTAEEAARQAVENAIVALGV